MAPKTKGGTKENASAKLSEKKKSLIDLGGGGYAESTEDECLVPVVNVARTDVGQVQSFGVFHISAVQCDDERVTKRR
jgi:hypothetical protein